MRPRLKAKKPAPHKDRDFPGSVGIPGAPAKAEEGLLAGIQFKRRLLSGEVLPSFPGGVYPPVCPAALRAEIDNIAIYEWKRNRLNPRALGVCSRLQSAPPIWSREQARSVTPGGFFMAPAQG